jgi:UDP-GlcNAc3NAcA epimerase
MDVKLHLFVLKQWINSLILRFEKQCRLIQQKKIITIIGARPQIIKASAISRAIKEIFSEQLTEVIVHTGQHYDENMSKLFFEELDIPHPLYNLNVGSGSHGAQTGKMLDGLEQIFLKEKPDGVIVYGDTNSTIAGALAAAKIHIPVIHIEAGLRSFNKKMPEEINRIACDHMSTLLFTPTKTGFENLKKEGFEMNNSSSATIDSPIVYHSGDIMYDNSLYFSSVSDKKSQILNTLGLEKNLFLLCTIHRDSNTDDAEKLTSIISALLHIQRQSGQKIILPLHPRTKGKVKEIDSTVYKELIENKEFVIIEPVGFLDVIALEKNASMIITDSGGLQKEAYFFNKPCIILRPQTEWLEIVENGNAILADSDEQKIIASYNRLSQKTDFTHPPFYGDGKAAYFICEKILNDLM